MPHYNVALILTVEADNYRDALDTADAVATGVGIGGENISAVMYYEHDNEGQRVVYLHPESQTLEEYNTL